MQTFLLILIVVMLAFMHFISSMRWQSAVADMKSLRSQVAAISSNCPEKREDSDELISLMRRIAERESGLGNLHRRLDNVAQLLIVVSRRIEKPTESDVEIDRIFEDLFGTPDEA